MFPKNSFRFFTIWLVIITSFFFLIQFPVKLPLIIMKHSVLSKPIYPFLIPPNFYRNSYNPLLQFLNSNTNYDLIFSSRPLPSLTDDRIRVMTANVPLLRILAGRGSLLCKSGPIYVISFYQLSRPLIN